MKTLRVNTTNNNYNYTSILAQLNQTDDSLFEKFINMILNDAIHLLEDVLLKLPEIRVIELAKEDLTNWMLLDEVLCFFFLETLFTLI